LRDAALLPASVPAGGGLGGLGAGGGGGGRAGGALFFFWGGFFFFFGFFGGGGGLGARDTDSIVDVVVQRSMGREDFSVRDPQAIALFGDVPLEQVAR